MKLEEKPALHLLTIWRLRLCIAAAVPAFLAVPLLRLPGWITLCLAAIWAGAFLYFYIFYYPIKLRKLAYSANDAYLLVHCGVIYTRVKAMPFACIQYTSILTTPLDRLFGLQTLVAFAPGARVHLPGLLPEAAARIQQQLIARMGEEEPHA